MEIKLPQILSAPTFENELLITGWNLAYKSDCVLFVRYSVAALSFPKRMVLASAKVISLTALIKIGVASLTASSAALLRTFKPSSAKLLKPISRNVLSTFWISSGHKILTN